MQAAELQVRAQTAGGVLAGHVATGGVRRGPVGELVEATETGGLARRQDRGLTEVGCCWQRLAVDTRRPPRRRRLRGGCRPPVRPPAAVERREDLVRRPGAGGDVVGRDGVGRVDPDQPHTPIESEHSFDGLVTAGAVRAEVVGDEHLGGVDLPRHLGHDVDRQPPPHHEPAIRALVEIGQAAGQEGQPGAAGGPLQDRVHHEERDHLVSRRQRRQQRRVVGQAEVPPQPEDRRLQGEVAASAAWRAW